MCNSVKLCIIILNNLCVALYCSIFELYSKTTVFQGFWTLALQRSSHNEDCMTQLCGKVWGHTRVATTVYVWWFAFMFQFFIICQCSCCLILTWLALIVCDWLFCFITVTLWLTLQSWRFWSVSQRLRSQRESPQCTDEPCSPSCIRPLQSETFSSACRCHLGT